MVQKAHEKELKKKAQKKDTNSTEKQASDESNFKLTKVAKDTDPAYGITVQSTLGKNTIVVIQIPY